MRIIEDANLEMKNYQVDCDLNIPTLKIDSSFVRKVKRHPLSTMICHRNFDSSFGLVIILSESRLMSVVTKYSVYSITWALELITKIDIHRT